MDTSDDIGESGLACTTTPTYTEGSTFWNIYCKTIIEGMNAGTPIVATAHASIPEYVKDSHNGYLVAKQSPEQLAAAFAKLIPIAHWSELAKASRVIYNADFNKARIQEQLIKLFTK